MFPSKDSPGLVFHCHNCSLSVGFSNFLKHVDTERHKDYVMEKFKDTYKQPQASITKPVEPKQPVNALTSIDDAKDWLPSMAVLPDSHYAKQYIMARKIPKQYWDEIFYAEDFMTFLDAAFPGHGKELKPDDPRIIMFYTNTHGMITNVSGRALSADVKTRYISIKVSDLRKVFGLHRLDLRKPVYITEGQFDSLFLPNAIASGDANLAGLADWMYDTLGVKATLVYDREPRNRELVKTIKDAIEANNKVCLLPEKFNAKDINEAVLQGLTITEIQRIIDEHTYTGLIAGLEFAKWKKR